MHGPWARVPGIDVLESRISQYSNAQANKKGTPEQRAREYMQRYQENEEMQERKRKEEYEAQMRDHLTPMHSGSLAASRWRQELAARTGNAKRAYWDFMSGPKQWLADMKAENDVLWLRREALQVARELIEHDPEYRDKTPEEIELAACDLCDRQMQEIKGVAHGIDR